MQTFIPFMNLKQTAKCLDRLRLGKQRIECVQIAHANLGFTVGWVNHPITKMWKNYLPYLIKVYLKEIMDEWISRGYKNTKTQMHYEELCSILEGQEVNKPHWLTEEFCEKHRHILYEKDPYYYKRFSYENR